MVPLSFSPFILLLTRRQWHTMPLSSSFGVVLQKCGKKDDEQRIVARHFFVMKKTTTSMLSLFFFATKGTTMTFVLSSSSFGVVF